MIGVISAFWRGSAGRPFINESLDSGIRGDALALGFFCQASFGLRRRVDCQPGHRAARSMTRNPDSGIRRQEGDDAPGTSDGKIKPEVPVHIAIDIPDTISGVIASEQDPARATLEALALEGYPSGRLGESAVRRLLGFETRMEVHGFLKEHGVYLQYGMEDLEHDMREADRIVAY
jgi:hypothetical protein